MKKIVLTSILIFMMLSITKLHAQFEQKLTIGASAGFLYLPSDVGDSYMGISVDGGILYNFSRRSSLVTNLRFFVLGGEYNALVGLGYKLNVLPLKKLNPYLFMEGSINYYVNFEEQYQGYALGAYPGIGFDYRLNDNLGLFAQGGMNYIVDIPNELILNIRYYQLGVRINFLKSKDL